MEQESNKVSTILQCFVDTNLELNEYFPYRQADLKEVFFVTRGQIVPENTSVPITISLNEPSTEGVETVTLGFVPRGATADDINAVFPQTITWEPGEQQKTIFVEVVRDFRIELGEVFDIAIIGAFNVLPQVGADFTSISIEDTTVLRRASLLQNDNSFILPYWNGAQNLDYLTYEVSTLSFPTLRVALDQPSESGIEQVNLMIFRGVTSPEFVLNKVVSFEQGEQYKDVPIDNIPSVVLNNSDVLLAKLFTTTQNLTELTASINFDFGYSEALIYVNVLDPGVQRKFTTLIFNDIYRQKGANINGNPVELRTVSYSDGNIPELDETKNNWLLRFGDTYKDFTNYDDGYPFQPVGIYKYGIDFNGVPVEFTLLVTNEGESAVQIDGQTYNPGEVYETIINSAEFQLTLPSNAGFSQDPSEFSEFQEFNSNGIYTETVYSFAIRNNGQTYFSFDNEETVYYRHNFTPTDQFNDPNNEFQLGLHNLSNSPSQIQSFADPQYLATRYTDVLTRYNGGECTDGFVAPDNVLNIRVLGLILLDGSGNQSQYSSSEFISLSEFEPICGEFNNTPTEPNWRGIPFDIPSGGFDVAVETDGTSGG